MDAWKPVTERILKNIPPLPEIASNPSEWHPLNGPPEMEPWNRAMIAAGAYAGSGVRGYSEWGGQGGDDDGPV
jgi:hypothetical protein